MRTVFAALLALAFAPVTLACSCPFGPMTDQAVRKAKNIFVFQLVSARIVPEEEAEGISAWAEAEIRVVEELQGAAPGTRMRYTTYWCCGSKLDIGHYYAAFLESGESNFRGHSGNLLPMGSSYQADDPQLESVVSGKVTLEKAYGEFPASDLDQMGRPPPPCHDDGGKNHPSPALDSP